MCCPACTTPDRASAAADDDDGDGNGDGDGDGDDEEDGVDNVSPSRVLSNLFFFSFTLSFPSLHGLLNYADYL